MTSAPALKHALLDLPAQDRHLVLMRHADGLTDAEIAEVVEMERPLVTARLDAVESWLKEHGQ